MIKGKMKRTVLGLLCILSLTGCQALSPQGASQTAQVSGNTGPATISELIELSDRLHFPDLQSASNMLLSASGYVENLTPFEVNYLLFNTGTQTTIPKGDLALEWSIKERDKIIKLTMEFEDAFKTYGIKFDDTINMIKIKDGTRLPGVFISENGIVMSQAAVDMHKDELKEVFIQTLFKMYLANHTDVLDDMTAAMGFKPLESIRLTEKMAEHIVIRPETLKPYYYEAKRGDVDASPVYNWVPITFINRDSGRLEDYMLAVTLTTNGEAIANTIASKNMYLPSIDVLNSYMAVPLNKLMDSDERFGELPDQFTHPEDILALNFMYMVLDRPVTGTATIEKLKAKFDK